MSAPTEGRVSSVELAIKTEDGEVFLRTLQVGDKVEIAGVGDDAGTVTITVIGATT